MNAASTYPRAIRVNVTDLVKARVKDMRAELRRRARSAMWARLTGRWNFAAAREEQCAAIRLDIARMEGRAHG